MLPVMRALLIAVTVSSLSALAQQQPDSEFVMPSFPNTTSPTAPPVPAPDDQTLSSPPIPVAPIRTPPRVPAEPTWARLGAQATLLATGINGYFVGGDLALLVTALGTPVSSPTVPGEVEGWVLQFGLEGGYGRAGAAQCEGSLFCATRASGGLLAKTGWGRGLPHVGDSITRLQTMYFAQLEVLLSHFNIESAPLSPGVKTFELLTRLRIGLHFTGEASRVTSTGITLQAAVIIEAIPVSRGTQGVSIGASVGAGF